MRGNLSYVLIALTYILQSVLVQLVSMIGNPTESQKAFVTTFSLFIVGFFNTGVLLLFVNANLKG